MRVKDNTIYFVLFFVFCFLPGTKESHESPRMSIVRFWVEFKFKLSVIPIWQYSLPALSCWFLTDRKRLSILSRTMDVKCKNYFFLKSILKLLGGTPESCTLMHHKERMWLKKTKNWIKHECLELLDTPY